MKSSASSSAASGKIKVKDLKDYSTVDEQHPQFNSNEFKALTNYIGYMRSIRCISKFNFYMTALDMPLPDRYSYIIAVRTLYGKPKTRVYSIKGDMESSFFAIIDRALNNLIKSNLIFYWSNYTKNVNCRDAFKKMINVEVNFNKFIYMLYTIGAINEYPTYEVVAVKGGKNGGIGARAVNVSYNVGNDVISYRGTVYNIIGASKDQTSVFFAKSRTNAMKKILRYLGPKVSHRKS